MFWPVECLLSLPMKATQILNQKRECRLLVQMSVSMWPQAISQMSFTGVSASRCFQFPSVSISQNFHFRYHHFLVFATYWVCSFRELVFLRFLFSGPSGLSKIFGFPRAKRISVRMLNWLVFFFFSAAAVRRPAVQFCPISVWLSKSSAVHLFHSV